MIIFPDIELQNGKCVNLVRGQMDRPVVYDVDPVEAAKGFASDGAEWLHVVDLDAVAQNETNNSKIIEEIIASVHVPVQVAGGIRTLTAIDRWFEKGAGRVVIGTAAVAEPQLVRDAAGHHPGKIVVSVDARNGQVVCEGWQKTTAWTPLEFARQFELLDLAGIIFTDIDRDDDLPESTLATTTELASSLILSVISSGTVKSLDDISTLHYLPNISGAIVGRAFFNGEFTLRDAFGVIRDR
ncbi:MAG: 1-(5-phosphoribosyl)-5-[(5-phosphoribosylamino)methylideneamino] imidazole-4-carboxamide isomerase [Pseudomonadota bacterium]